MGTSRAYVEATLLILFGWIILLKYYECALAQRLSGFAGPECCCSRTQHTLIMLSWP